MESLGSIVELWRYPIKSMRGEQLTRASAGERGLAGDRGWAVLDSETGKIASAKRPKLWLELLQCSASYVSEPNGAGAAAVRITTAAGREITSDDPDCDAQLSEMVGRQVTLASVAPEGATYELSQRDANGLTVSDPEALTEAQVGPYAPPGTFFDTSTLHVLSTNTLGELSGFHADGEWDVRRFRPNVVVTLDNGSAGFAENGWVGSTLHLGDDAQAAVLAPMPRCVMTTLPQPGLQRDPLILRTLAEQNRIELEGFGTYACVGALTNVTQAGVVSVGDAFAMVAAG